MLLVKGVLKSNNFVAILTILLLRKQFKIQMACFTCLAWLACLACLESK
jgi:hypothetical protein